MKKFKDIMNVMENYNAWGSTNRTALSDAGTFYIERPEQLNKLNVFIESYMNRGFIDITSAFNHLRARLNLAGIDFTLNTPIQEGHMEFPVTRHGGSFGTVPNHDLLKQGFYRDSGVPGMEFSLQADVELGEGGMYNIDAKIVQIEVEEDVEESWIPEESVEHLDEWGIPADQDAYYAANKKKWEKEGDAKTRKQWKDAMKKMKKKKKKK